MPIIRNRTIEKTVNIPMIIESMPEVFFSPFLGLIFIHFILGEDIYYTTFIGLIFIVVGIFIQKIRLPKR